MQGKIPLRNAYEFLLAGKCHVMFYTPTPKKGAITTVNKFSYYIKRKKEQFVWYVYTEQMIYLGYIRGDVFVKTDTTPLIISLAEQKDYFGIFWKHIVAQTLPDRIHILHVGTCGHCGRKLSDPTSLETGIGPECRKKLSYASANTRQIDSEISTGESKRNT
jgi:hypothetical protein